MSPSLKTQKYSENANSSAETKKHLLAGPIAVLFILVQRVGFEPTNACAIGS